MGSLDGAMSERDQQKPEDHKDTPVQPDTVSAPPPPPAAGDAGLELELQAFIGRQLVANYNEVLEEPVPDRFVELLRKLEQDKAGEP
jgi:hypothetical protein